MTGLMEEIEQHELGKTSKFIRKIVGMRSNPDNWK